jgi:hypothetical protein
MKQVTKLGLLFAVLACSMHGARTASLKSAKAVNGANLAQAGCDLQSGGASCSAPLSVEDCYPVTCPPITPPVGGPLGGGVVTSTGLTASASQLTETNIWDDNRCASVATAHREDEGCESSCSYGCGCRKRTVCLEGDICYRNIRSSTESGEAAERGEACEQSVSTTTTALTSIECPIPCIDIVLCPPGAE